MTTTGPTGRALLDLICTRELAPPPAADLLRIDLVRTGDGETVFGFDARPEYGNPGAVHGGVLAAIADFALTTAIWTVVPAATDIVTTDLHTSYLRRLELDGRSYTCTGTVLHVGTTQANAVATIADVDGRIHVHATATCRLRRP